MKYLKNLWLLLTGLILSTVILTTGQASYNAKINQSTISTINDKQPTVETKTKTENSQDSSQLNKTTLSPVSQTNFIDAKDEPKQESTDQNVSESQISNNQKQSVQTPSSSSAEALGNKQFPVSTSPQITPEPKQTQTINQTVDFSIQSVGNYQTEFKEGDTAWDIMKRTAAKYYFPMSYQIYDFGIYVSKIGGLEAHDNYYWALYYNGEYSMIGVSFLKVKLNDKIEWKFETW